MDSLITVFLPLALAIIMFSLGLGLTLDDFRRILVKPKAFAVGAFAQLILIPVVAYILAVLFKLPPELAVGMMILAFCPGGVTANLLTKLAGGEVALSISLTGVISLVAVFTVPVLVVFFANHFMGLDAPAINVTALGVSMFLITLVPVAVGILVRRFAKDFAIKLEGIVSKIAVVMFVIVVVGALGANWRVFMDNALILAPALVILNVILLAAGLAFGRLFSLTEAQGRAIALETGIQNATLGITVGSLIVEQASALPPFSLPSGVYGITMYLVSIPFVFWLRRRRVEAAAIR
ncbi:bile acid:sodium symporter family protein [Aquamicrobium sp. LC103]|uniref:bile acid:sodium symporter family protein n=1 Tax=Aquamicrobium sp. LC103 TaxID=1120658 RepID=UPI00063E7EF8|nr:bile acid:sodium symporter family protein [Aquamicrobium sp. LC103]TKT69158.1 bile acid:sodium symporter family protein [Aquamicrobium sp. LC103]